MNLLMKKIVFLCTFFSVCHLFSQEDAWVFLKDKPNYAVYLESPLSILSQRALNRRARQNIPLDVKDVPVNASYCAQLQNATGITVLATSKWLNAIHIQGAQTAINELVATYSFIDEIEYANKALNAKRKRIKPPTTKHHTDKFANQVSELNYGSAETQITMLKGDYLHEEGYTGEGMQIAVIDAGFPNVDQLDAFERLRTNHKILGGYDFVNRSTEFYTGHNHGTNVLSAIGGYIEDVFVGTAPDASFYLFITEDAAKEVPLEESLWVEAAERADSLGVDVINTSLGYTTFDNANYNYSYSDMDGETTFISRGAAIGASRGMLLVNSAGNSGNDTWKYMGAPADAAAVFSIGAVNATRAIATFSSFGPTADNRIKPDVLAHGQSVFVIDHVSGNPKTSNGTSFSSPVIAGVLACFWQAFPNLTSTQIMQRIRESADRYDSPDAQYGYGIPDFKAAYSAVLHTDEAYLMERIAISPNPVADTVVFTMNTTHSNQLSIQIFSTLGKKVFEEENLKSKTVDVSQLPGGVYILTIKSGTYQKTLKLIKK